jgi:WD40 repeat protein
MKELGDVDYNVSRIQFTPEGTRLFVSGNSFACFDVRTGRRLWKFDDVKGAWRLAVSGDGKTAVLGSTGGFAIIEMDGASSQPTKRFRPYTSARQDMEMIIAPDNRTLVMNYSGTLISWDIPTGKETNRLQIPDVRGGGFGPQLGGISPDGQALITNFGYLQRWDLAAKKPLFDAPPADGLTGRIENLTFTPDGKEILAWSSNHAVARWDVATKKRNPIPTGEFTMFRQVFLTREGLRTIEGRSHQPPSYEVTIRDPLSDKTVQTVRWANSADEKDLRVFLWGYTLTSNAKTLLITYPDVSEKSRGSFVTATDVASGKRLAHFAVPGRFFHMKSPFSPCGRWVALGGKVYHVATGKLRFTPTAENGESLSWLARQLPGFVFPNSPAWFSEDGRFLAGWLLRHDGDKSVSTGGFAVWDAASENVLARWREPGTVVQVAFAPDGRTMALLDAQGIRIQNLLTGQPLAAYDAVDVTCGNNQLDLSTLVFSPDGRTLASGQRDGSIYLWKVPEVTKDLSRTDRAERERLWADLASNSPANARAAIYRLVSDAPAATALVTAKARVIVKPEDPMPPKLVKDLDSELFATRDQATRKLREYGVKAESALRRALAGRPSIEMKRRIEAILADIVTPLPALLPLPLSAERLRSVRAIEVLERAGTPEAQNLLRTWAERAEDVGLGAEAQAALERIRH